MPASPIFGVVYQLSFFMDENEAFFPIKIHPSPIFKICVIVNYFDLFLRHTKDILNPFNKEDTMPSNLEDIMSAILG